MVLPSQNRNSFIQFHPRHHDLQMAKIEFHKKIFLLEDIKGKSKNLMLIRRVLSQSFSWNTTTVPVKETLALVSVLALEHFNPTRGFTLRSLRS